MNNNLYIFIEALQKTYGAGGIVMLPILICGAIGFYYLYSAWFRIGRDYFRKDSHKVVERLREDLKNSESGEAKTARNRLKKRSGILARELHLALKVAVEKPLEYEDYMQVRMIKTLRYMQQGNHIVSVMAAAAPLLGLLGTVTGMVSTFEVITLYGNQNPVLMADGISEALISTQSGLLIAFPLTLLKQRLDERIDILSQQLQLGATVIENYLTASRADKRHPEQLLPGRCHPRECEDLAISLPGHCCLSNDSESTSSDNMSSPMNTESSPSGNMSSPTRPGI